MKVTPILLSLTLSASLFTPGTAQAATSETATEAPLSTADGASYDFLPTAFPEWMLNEQVSVKDSYGAVHKAIPKQFSSNGTTSITLKLAHTPSAASPKESIFYIEFYTLQNGELVYDSFKEIAESSPQTHTLTFGSSFFDQEFIYIRMGMLKDYTDEYLSGETFRKIRNPYFKGNAAPEKEDTIIVSNESTDVNLFQSSGTFSLDALNQTATMSESFTQDTYKVDFIPPFDPEKVNASILQQNEHSITPNTTVGTVKTFNVLNIERNQYEKISATLMYSGTRSNVWVHNGQITATQAKAMGEEFDRTIYPLVTANFAKESDRDKNGKVAMLVFDIKDGFAQTGGYVAGYFSPQDLYAASYSNQGEIFYIDTYPTMGETKATYDVSKAFSTIAHEFQHMVNFNQNVFVEQGEEMDIWLNEALSMAAEQLYLKKPLQSRIDYFEQSTSIANGHSLLYWDYDGDTLSNYSLSYLFGQYLQIQAGQGDLIFKELMNSKGADTAALEALVRKYIDPSKTFGQFLTDFRQALYLNQTQGLYGFKGKPVLSDIDSPTYGGALPKKLRGGGAINVPVADAKTFSVPADKGKSITYRIIDPKTVARISGTDRYATAVSISRKGWISADTVILATGADFPDALAGGPLAYQQNAPILLTKQAALHAETEAEIHRLNAKRVIILGSSGAVSEEVEAKLVGMGLEVDRIGGKTRYETAAKIAALLPSEQAVVAYGANFPDVLSISPYAAKNGLPILLTRTDQLPAETAAAIKGKKSTIVVGSTGVISEAVKNQLPAPVRYGGKNRYETGKQIIDGLPLGTDKAFVATGRNFPDALAGSVLAAKQDAPILLVNGTVVPDTTKILIPAFKEFAIFGGKGTVGSDVKLELERAMRK